MTAAISRVDPTGPGSLVAERKVEFPALESLKLINDRDRGAVIDAMLLARLPGETIARRMKLPSDQVKAYEELFFDVADSLQYRDYIVRSTIAPEWSVGTRGSRRRRVAMKALAYLCGPQALDDIFGLRNELSPKHWSAPHEAVKQLALENAVCAIADLIPYPGHQPDGDARAAVDVEPILALLKEPEVVPNALHELSVRTNATLVLD